MESLADTIPAEEEEISRFLGLFRHGSRQILQSSGSHEDSSFGGGRQISVPDREGDRSSVRLSEGPVQVVGSLHLYNSTIEGVTL